MVDVDEWRSRLHALNNELVQVEESLNADEVEVKTYPERTVVTLTYDHTDASPAGEA